MTPGVDLFLRVLRVGERLCVEGKGEGLYIELSQASVRYSENEKEGTSPSFPFFTKGILGSTSAPFMKQYTVCGIFSAKRDLAHT